MAATARYQASGISVPGNIQRAIGWGVGGVLATIGCYGSIALALSLAPLTTAQLGWYSLVLASGGLLGIAIGQRVSSRGRSLLARSAPLSGAIVGMMLANGIWLVLQLLAVS